MKSLFTLLAICIAFLIVGQTEPGHTKALKELKKMRYEEYVSKKTGFSIDKCKLTKYTEGLGGSEAKYLTKTDAADRNYWPKDKLVYLYQIKTPKDADGVTQTYTFSVVYRRTKCASNGYGCILYDDWFFYKTYKYGPRIEGAKSVSPELVVSGVKDYLSNNKEAVISDFSGYDMKNWIEFKDISYPPAGDLYHEQKIETKTERVAYAYVSGTKAEMTISESDTRINNFIEMKTTVKVFLGKSNNEWKVTKVVGLGYAGVEKTTIKNDDLLAFYETYENVNFEEIYNNRIPVELPTYTCGQFQLSAQKVMNLLHESISNYDKLEPYYLNKDDFEKDKAFIQFLTEKSFSFTIDSANLECKFLPNGTYSQMNFKLSHDKLKGKIIKEIKPLFRDNQQNNFYYLTKNGTYEFSINLEYEVDENKWMLKSWCNDVFGNFKN